MEISVNWIQNFLVIMHLNWSLIHPFNTLIVYLDSETQKFGHVTFFWNGNRSGKIDETLETYHEIPSDNIQFNEAPHMKAAEIAKAAKAALLSGDFDYVRVNFANGDMVGHTGDLEATKRACEAVDQGVKVRFHLFGCQRKLIECFTILSI